MGTRQFDSVAAVSVERSSARRPSAPEPVANRSPRQCAPASAAATAVTTGFMAQGRALALLSGGRLARAGQVLLRLQGQKGNRYVQQVVDHARAARTLAGPGFVPMIQTKLVLGSADDLYERAADRAARQVTSRAASHGAAGGDSTAATGSAHLNLEASVSRALGTGEPLAGSVAAPMEEAFGVDFRRVRLHRDAESDDLCQSMSARAFTVGDHIFLRRGEHAGASAGTHLLAHELAHVVQQRGQAVRAGGATGPAEAGRAPVNTIQRFWVLRNGHYHWVSGQSRKRRYVRTNARRQTFWHPSKHRVYIDPWTPEHTQLQIDPTVEADLETEVIADLEKIRNTEVGADLLQELATAPWKTTIYPTSVSQPPKTSIRGPKEPDPTITMHPADVDAVALLEKQRHRVLETEPAVWNPIPRDVALFHELVHAYHWVNGTTAKGKVTKVQAIHPGDAGVNLREYQAVGLDTADGEHLYSEDRFTENQYRSERHPQLPRRDAYNLRSERQYSESSRRSASGSSGSGS